MERARNALAKRLSAAKERDRIDAERAALMAKEAKPVRSRIDSQITAIVNALGLFGRTVDAYGREVVASVIDWQRVVMLELMSSFGPELVLLLFLAFDPKAAAEQRVIEETRKAAKLEAQRAAERRVFEYIPEFAEAVANVAASAVPQPAAVQATELEEKAFRVHEDPNGFPTPQWMEREMTETEESVLDIVGRDAPAFTQAPVTPMEHIAAATLQMDPERPTGRKVRRKIQNKDSVKIWHKERTIGRYGRHVMQEDLHTDYCRWCVDMHLIPEKAGAFGKVLRDELHIENEYTPRKRYKYHHVGLKPYLVAVA